MDMQSKTVNDLDPMCDMLIDVTVIRDWQGQHIGFCSEECAEEWDALSAEEKNEKLAIIGSQE